MADNIPITPGSGLNVASDDVSGVQYQRIKLDVGGDGVAKPVIQGGSDGLPVDVLSVAGNVTVKPLAGQVFPVNDNSGSLTVDDGASSLTVDAPVGTPVFVRLSDGTSPIATLPVSGTVAVTQSTAAANSGAWPAKISDGTDTVGISTVSAAKALKVDVVQTVSTTGAATDSSTFTDGASKITPIGGEYNDSAADPTAGQAAGARITQKRAVHVNIRKADGTELGISATPLRVDPTGTTTQPVNVGQVGGNSVSTVANGVQKVALADSAGTSISATVPVVVTRKGQGETRVTKSVTLSASQTGATLWTPATGKAFYIRKIVLVVTTAGPLTIFDGTNSAANIVADSGSATNWPTGVWPLDFDEPWASAAVNNILKYTSGSGLVGVLTAHGYEA